MIWGVIRNKWSFLNNWPMWMWSCWCMSESDGCFTNGDVMKNGEKGMIIVDICVQVKNENVCFCLWTFIVIKSMYILLKKPELCSRWLAMARYSCKVTNCFWSMWEHTRLVWMEHRTCLSSTQTLCGSFWESYCWQEKINFVAN